MMADKRTRFRAVLGALACIVISARSAAQVSPTTRPTARFQDLPTASVAVDLNRDEGPLELWRHAIGHGGVNSHPLPDRVVNGLSQLHPRLIRVFIQEFFNIYPEHGRFDWSKLDPYMEALDKTGAKVVAAITIKPKPLFPQIDASIWRPNDVKEWQRVIAALVKRYSVDRPIVTYWEIGNETDIGENGGCPYLIGDPKDYSNFYAMTIEPIVTTFPKGKVGGPGVANAGSDYLLTFVERCREQRLRLDFVSWHLYSDDPESHAGLVQKFRRVLEPFGDHGPEMLITEWNKGFDSLSVEELAFEPRRAANAAACILAVNDAKVDWSFYYHAWDQVCYLDEFNSFFRDPRIMYHHWNEVPHRFGLFGVNQEVRPQYFVYQMLGRMGDRRVAAKSDAKDVRVLAAHGKESDSVLLVNFDRHRSRDFLVNLHLSGFERGPRELKVFRIDRSRRWSADQLTLVPAEHRAVDLEDKFSLQLYCPADSVALVEFSTTKHR